MMYHHWTSRPSYSSSMVASREGRREYGGAGECSDGETDSISRRIQGGLIKGLCL